MSRPTGRPGGAATPGRGVVLVLVLAWCGVVLPRLVQSFTVDKHRTTLDDPLPYSVLGQVVDRGLQAALLLVCAVVVLRGLGDLPTRHRRALTLLVAPWGYVVLRDLYVGLTPHRLTDLAYPACALALWVARPRLEQLRVLGYLHGVTVVLSLGMGALVPERGVYQAVTGGALAPDKQILPIGILIGPFTNGNNCAQVLLLGLPTLAFLPRPALRRLLVGLTALALVWTSSRSSIGGMVVGGLVLLALRRTAGLRGPVSAAVLLAGLGGVVALPLLTSDPEAFTNRGLIWQESLRAWSSSPWFGNGSDWYLAAAKYVNPLGALAFHGHNQAVQVLTTSGLVGVALVLLLFAAAAVPAVRWADRGVAQPTVFLAVLLVSSSQEVSFGFVDRSFLAAVAMLPVMVLALCPPPGPRLALPGGEAAGGRPDDEPDEQVETAVGGRGPARDHRRRDRQHADAL